jgi:hypothetical protein
MVYGGQQWKRGGLSSCDLDELSFLYMAIALVKKKEAEAAKEAAKEAEEGARSGARNVPRRRRRIADE